MDLKPTHKRHTLSATLTCDSAWNAVSNCSQGSGSQPGQALRAAISLYAPGTPWYATLQRQAVEECVHDVDKQQPWDRRSRQQPQQGLTLCCSAITTPCREAAATSAAHLQPSGVQPQQRSSTCLLPAESR